jgi:hypothetical protein
MAQPKGEKGLGVTDQSVRVGSGARVVGSAIGSGASVSNQSQRPGQIRLGAILLAVVVGIVSNVIYGWFPWLINLAKQHIH